MTIPCRTIKKALFEKTTVFFIAAILSIVALYACKDDDDKDEEKTIRFAVIADPHLYDTGLGTTGPDFEEYLRVQIKMLEQSAAIFETAMAMVMAQDPLPEFLLIPGDLTKDGEEESHHKIARYLKEITDAGIDVFVVPGNHDVSNPEAMSYHSTGSARIYSPGPEEFAQIYAPYGYDQAISRDTHSLSYVAEPVPGLRLLAIDACLYEENPDDFHLEGGRIKAETMQWLLENLEQAAQDGADVIAMMHHGLVEHLENQGYYLPEFIIEDWDAVGYELAAAGMNVIFTGHWHTQNITRRQWDDETFVVEIQTGTLGTYPVPMRIVDFDMNASRMAVKSLFVEELPPGSYPEGYCCFSAYAYDFTYTYVLGFAADVLEDRFDLSPAQLEGFVPMLADATMAHFAGDERPELGTLIEAWNLATSDDSAESEIGLMVLNLWWDRPPKDNNETVVLKP